MSSRALPLLLGSALLLSACASTVQESHQVGAVGAVGDGLVSDGSSTPGSSGSVTDIPGTSNGSALSSTNGGQVGPGRRASTGTTGAPGRSAATSSGSAGAPVTTIPAASKTISIGFIYTSGRAEAAAALGAAGVTSGDEKAQWDLLIAHVNKHGGLGGRTIKPVYFGEKANGSGTLATTEKAACDSFTQDNHVLAAVSSFEFTDTFQACMQKRGVPTFYSLESLNASAQFRATPGHFEASDLALDRQGTELGSGLFGQGYFNGKVPAVNGIITYDTPAFVAAADALKASLARRGIKVRDTRTLPFPAATSDTTTLASAISSSELAFASEGIDHVMIFDLNGLVSLLFMENAQSQAYHPRYGLTSQSSGSHLADLLGSNANAQLKDAMGVGWIPVLDLNGADYTVPKSSVERRTCRDIMVKGGQSQGLSSPGAELVALGQCDDIFLIQVALSRVTGALSGPAIAQAVSTSSAGFRPSDTFATAITTQRHDGVAAVRDMSYVTSCACFRYVGAQRGLAP